MLAGGDIPRHSVTPGEDVSRKASEVERHFDSSINTDTSSTASTHIKSTHASTASTHTQDSRGAVGEGMLGGRWGIQAQGADRRQSTSHRVTQVTANDGDSPGLVEIG